MTLAIFDLDNTLIAGDSDHSFGEYLAERGLVNWQQHCATNDRFYQDYLAGQLDIIAYSAFALGPIVGRPPHELRQLQQDFLADKIAKMELPKARALIEKHRSQGDDLLIITATNRFVTAPIAEWLGINELLATEPEVIDGYYTGKVVGTPCYQGGKVIRLQEWLAGYAGDLNNSYFYSDSFNDLPLLGQVDNPVAVDPDDRLRAHAEANNWPIISLR
ncbi:HAD family hydrolase [Halioxenophilus sp. WMMB6]|uniref:histidinol-phosphatase n=1 Tax=Halioxenophilus sp. WMMB6 TaxID=3073815 RepID=UPI00295ED70E|nr:HAD family hydrolase [Halioxenophilus sp. WMMB6]